MVLLIIVDVYVLSDLVIECLFEEEKDKTWVRLKGTKKEKCIEEFDKCQSITQLLCEVFQGFCFNLERNIITFTVTNSTILDQIETRCDSYKAEIKHKSPKILSDAKINETIGVDKLRCKLNIKNKIFAAARLYFGCDKEAA